MKICMHDFEFYITDVRVILCGHSALGTPSRKECIAGSVARMDRWTDVMVQDE
jgi:hypothetical protein